MLSINRQAILDNLLLGQGILANCPILPGNWAYYPDLGSYSYDPDSAAQRIAALGITRNEAGVMVTSEGMEVRLVLLVPQDTLHQQIAEQIKQGWEAVGISVDLLVEPHDKVVARLEAHDYDAALVDIDLLVHRTPTLIRFGHSLKLREGRTILNGVPRCE